MADQEVTIKTFKQEITLTFVDRVLFDFGKATISPKGRAVLEKVGDVLKDVHDRRIRVIGHTDNIPIQLQYREKFPSNWELSAARAAAIVRYFIRKNEMNPTVLEAVGRSYYDPVASNETEEGRAQNRRVEILIAPVLKN
jgi:chemotaxis protein MotB